MPERALARISDGAIAAQLRAAAVRCSAADTELCAVVKADGYGHGAAERARAALRGGAAWLAVATAAEAAALRDAGIAERDPGDGRARPPGHGAGRRRRRGGVGPGASCARSPRAARGCT